ncbi:transcriptional regulator [Legionella quinlivanii]|uniref:Transcriptional regulator n=1 Tax=Legionella quinlivanii TaxID=45073 RepID=A0A364LGU6_9GAMM|nr:helix-turn-helix domain-containing protein [Legionella quinlivanii]RAP35470.1 transcriptional regulator [Legionella quinlivanii]
MSLQQKFSIYSEQCPSRNVFEKISDKWSILIINCLLDGTCRFGELKRKLEGISPKMLTQTLIKLERLGFVARESFPVLPLKVEYSLTALGSELGKILGTLREWTESNMEAIMLSSSQFDETRKL